MANEYAGANNPRTFAQVASLDAWRSPYSGEKALADLHIDVVFGEGRLGGEVDSPVRFILGLKRAEVHINLDRGGILEIRSSSVARPDQVLGKIDTVTETRGTASASGKIELTEKSAAMRVAAEGEASTETTRRFEQAEMVGTMSVVPIRTQRGYSFQIKSVNGETLTGQPWSSKNKRLELVDSKFDRKRGEPPEPTIEIHCRREDLLISKIQFKKQKLFSWARLSRKKQVAVEQYIKDELTRLGLDCGNLAEPYAVVVLSDAVPEVD